MLKVPRKQHTNRPRLRWALLACALLALAGSVYAWQALRRTPEPVPEKISTAGARIHVTPEEVAQITVALDTGDGWTARQETPGILTVAAAGDDPAFDMAASVSSYVLEAAAIVSWEAVLADTAADYAAHLQELGLSEPQAVVTVAYAGGEEVTFRIGSLHSDPEQVYYYMTLDGDPRLLALARGTAEEFLRERAALRPVTQPVIHKARIDRITLTVGRSAFERLRRAPKQRYTPRTVAATWQWTLDGSITDPDAADRWQLTRPYVYPADGEALSSLRANLANLILGPQVAPATPENLRRYGFEAPRLVIGIHQAAGRIMNGDGGMTDWPESTLTLAVGGSRSELADYILFDGVICRINHFTVAALMGSDASATLTRYVTLTSLSNLSALTLQEAGREIRWEVTRTERVAENNALVTDDTGSPVYDYAVTRNGEPADWETFSQMYGQLLLTTVSGRLPEGWRAAGPPTLQCVFETRTGLTHTLALYPLDALHSAVSLDGQAVFYIHRDALPLPAWLDTPAG